MGRTVFYNRPADSQHPGTRQPQDATRPRFITCPAVIRAIEPDGSLDLCVYGPSHIEYVNFVSPTLTGDLPGAWNWPVLVPTAS